MNVIPPVRFSSIQNPKNFIEDSRSIVNTFLFRFGSRNGILAFFDDLWKKENLVFLTFNDNLLAYILITNYLHSSVLYSFFQTRC